MDRHRQQAFLGWLFVGAVIVLTGLLAVLQYRWIGAVSVAERERLRSGLRTSLHRLSQDFNSEVTSACLALLPTSAQLDELGRDEAYATRYRRWKESSQHSRLFRRIALAVPEGDGVRLLRMDLELGALQAGEWPGEWNAPRERLQAWRAGQPPSRGALFRTTPNDAALIEIPRFPRSFMNRGRGGLPQRLDRPEPQEPQARPDTEWLLLEVDTDYFRESVLPALMERHLGGSKQDYQVSVVTADSQALPVYPAAPLAGTPDASVRLFELQYDQIFRRLGQFRGRGVDGRKGSPGEGPERGGMRPPPGDPPDRGRWLLSVRHRAGSLEAVVTQARQRNLAVTTAVLILILASMVALVRFNRRAQRLAELQMEFVAGVSHELRTPLSVIRTAGHNLGRGVVKDNRQVQRYGTLIRDEAERLTSIVEQVLSFANARAGRAIGEREPVEVAALIDGALQAAAGVLDGSGCLVEKKVGEGLPAVMGDRVSLSQAIQNLLSNAAKHGADGGWIGITASAPGNGASRLVEIRVRDRGSGIPRGELAQVFDPFYRGKRAIDGQIHGTGLGLSLVKRIVEAHQGSVTVHSEAGQGTEFVIRLPVAVDAEEKKPNEFADSAGGG